MKGPPGSFETDCSVVATPAAPVSACDEKLSRAIANIRQRGFEHADELLGRVRAECPNDAGPLRELSGVRFAQRRWNEAASLARQALQLSADDSYALDVLGSSLFMQEDGARCVVEPD